MNFFYRKRKMTENQLSNIESFLSNLLEPVEPSEDFVKDLGARLDYYSNPIIISPGANRLGRYTLVAMFTLLCGMMVVAFIIRYVVIFKALVSLKNGVPRF